MREKQCKYVNVFVYSFYLFFFFFLILAFFFSSLFANETSMVHHMRSLFAWPRSVLGHLLEPLSRTMLPREHRGRTQQPLTPRMGCERCCRTGSGLWYVHAEPRVQLFLHQCKSQYHTRRLQPPKTPHRWRGNLDKFSGVDFCCRGWQMLPPQEGLLCVERVTQPLCRARAPWDGESRPLPAHINKIPMAWWDGCINLTSIALAKVSTAYFSWTEGGDRAKTSPLWVQFCFP